MAQIGVHTVRLLLIRHAQTMSNISRLLDTEAPGPGLSSLGRRQAKGLIEALQDEYLDAIYVSTHARTALTAAPLAESRSLPTVVGHGLHEIPAGVFEMLGDTPSVEGYLAALRSWVDGDLSVRVPGGEDGHEFLGRFDAALNAIADSGAHNVAVFSHGGAIRTWALIRASQARPLLHPDRDIENTDIVVMEGAPTRWRVTELRPENRRGFDPCDPPGILPDCELL